jgi:hypothetical protein
VPELIAGWSMEASCIRGWRLQLETASRAGGRGVRGPEAGLALFRSVDAGGGNIPGSVPVVPSPALHPCPASLSPIMGTGPCRCRW